MAKGDVISGIASVASGSALVYQPPLGVEVVIKSVSGGEKVGTGYYVRLQLTDGTTHATIRHLLASGYDTLSAHSRGFENTSVLINNARYLRLYNYGATQNLAFTGIQIK